MRGATPLDVAAASVMDNNELALALTESDLEKVFSLLITCYKVSNDGYDWRYKRLHVWNTFVCTT